MILEALLHCPRHDPHPPPLPRGPEAPRLQSFSWSLSYFLLAAATLKPWFVLYQRNRLFINSVKVTQPEGGRAFGLRSGTLHYVDPQGGSNRNIPMLRQAGGGGAVYPPGEQRPCCVY